MRLGFRDLLIALLTLGIVLGLVFGVGAVYGRNTAPTPTAVAAAGGAAAAAGAGGGGAGGGGGGAGGAAGGGAAAAVNLLNGQTIGTITDVQNGLVTVRGIDARATTTTFAPSLSTQITNSVPGSVSDLRSGEFVAVNPGPPNAQGQTIAESIIVLPPSLAAGLPTPGAGAGARPSATPAR